MTRDPARSAVPEAVRRLVALPADEFQRLLAIPLTDSEREDTRALARWFTRRYPTPAERFAYIRRARARSVAMLASSALRPQGGTWGRASALRLMRQTWNHADATPAAGPERHGSRRG